MSRFYSRHCGADDETTFYEDSPLVVYTTGQATIPRKAERAVLNVKVSASGESQQWASDQVSATGKRLREMFEGLSPENDSSEEAKLDAVVAHWNMTRLTSTSRQPGGPDGKADDKAPPLFDVRLTFNVRVRKFSALGALASRLSGMTGVSLERIDWVLTAETQKSYESQLRRMAALDALAQAKEFGVPLGVASFRPVSIEPRGEMIVYTSEAAMYPRKMQTARAAGQGGDGERLFRGPEGQVEYADDDGSDLAFYPEDVNMKISVEVKFIGKEA